MLPVIFIVLACFQTATAQGWRGIVPLRSQRSDVERLLGPPRLPCPCDASSRLCRCQYETADGLVDIDYSPLPCGGYPSGWNVPANTVLGLSIRWNEPSNFSDLQLTESQFEKAGDDTFTSYYSSREKGVEYTVSSEKKLTRTSYIPTRKDLHLRCPCFPALDESTQRSTTFDVFSFSSVDDNARGRLDIYIISLSKLENSKGYAILYQGKRTGAKKNLHYKQAIAKHFYQTRGVSREKLVIIDGGYQEQPFIELFILPLELSAPEPRATWRPCQRT